MQYLIILLKANLILSICYLIHHIWLRKLTFYQLNRFYFLSVFAVAIMSPFLQIKLQASQTVEKISGNISFEELQRQFGQHHPSSATIHWADIVITIYLCGLAIMGITFLIKMVSLTGIYLKSEKSILAGRKIRLLKNETAPFSFFHTIFINKDAVENNHYQLILHHEMIHAKQYHSVDVLLAEAFKIISWFNPIVWFLQKELRENLEYITDEKILQLGVDAKMYQYNLLSSALYTQNVTITNHYNFSHLKNRIIMMNKDKSSNLQLTKYVLALPFVLLTSICVQQSNAQTKPQVPEKRAQKSAVATKATTPNIVIIKNDKVYINDAETPAKEVKKVTLKKVEGDTKSEDMEIQVIGDDTDASATDQNTKTIHVRTSNIDMTDSEQPIILLDGEQIFDISSINPDDIDQMNVYKGMQAALKFPQYRNAKGVIEIFSKKKG